MQMLDSNMMELDGEMKVANTEHVKRLVVQEKVLMKASESASSRVQLLLASESMCGCMMCMKDCKHNVLTISRFEFCYKEMSASLGVKRVCLMSQVAAISRYDGMVSETSSSLPCYVRQHQLAGTQLSVLLSDKPISRLSSFEL